MNALKLAYLGDAYYEYKIRLYLVNQNIERVEKLHKTCVTYTSSVAQSKIIEYFLENKILTETEDEIYLNGRNQKSKVRKNLNYKDHIRATGFETLIGSLLLNDANRCDYLIDLAINFVNS
ncbi:MAG: ribonuclease III [Acholeplasmatales bacterium]|jgi:ribonuclease-3 family protein|nr:ribonuclease III [Acholeplasmatales bacterium]